MINLLDLAVDELMERNLYNMGIGDIKETKNFSFIMFDDHILAKHKETGNEYEIPLHDIDQ